MAQEGCHSSSHGNTQIPSHQQDEVGKKKAFFFFKAIFWTSPAPFSLPCSRLPQIQQLKKARSCFVTLPVGQGLMCTLAASSARLQSTGHPGLGFHMRFNWERIHSLTHLVFVSIQLLVGLLDKKVGFPAGWRLPLVSSHVTLSIEKLTTWQLAF